MTRLYDLYSQNRFLEARHYIDKLFQRYLTLHKVSGNFSLDDILAHFCYQISMKYLLCNCISSQWVYDLNKLDEIEIDDEKLFYSKNKHFVKLDFGNEAGLDKIYNFLFSDLEGDRRNINKKITANGSNIGGLVMIKGCEKVVRRQRDKQGLAALFISLKNFTNRKTSKYGYETHEIEDYMYDQSFRIVRN